jgi:uncharacterized protein (TIGR03382 family)
VPWPSRLCACAGAALALPWGMAEWEWGWMRRKVALMKQQGTAAQPRRGAENKNGSGAAPRRWLIQIEGDGVEQCCRVGVKG